MTISTPAAIQSTIVTGSNGLVFFAPLRPRA
jgi:hypothetical protein